MTNRRTFLATAALSASALPGLASAAAGPASPLARHSAGTVYVMSNNASANEILVLARQADGALIYQGRVATGGQGYTATAPIDPLGSQGALQLSADGSFLFAVNAGSNQVSSFRLDAAGWPVPVSLLDSGGVFPASLALFGPWLYVLNKGSTGSIQGFEIGAGGRLKPLSGSNRGLGLTPTDPFAHVPAPEQIGFDATGRQLLITWGGARQFLSFAIDAQGLPAAEAVHNNALEGLPFSFVLSRKGQALVTDAAGGLGSYQVGGDTGLWTSISPPVPNFQAATCWVVFDGDATAYTANTGSGTLSAYRVAPNGTVALADSSGVALALGSGAAPTDMAFLPVSGGRLLYVLDGGLGRVSVLRASPATAALSVVGHYGSGVVPVQAGVQGIAVR